MRKRALSTRLSQSSFGGEPCGQAVGCTQTKIAVNEASRQADGEAARVKSDLEKKRENRCVRSSDSNNSREAAIAATKTPVGTLSKYRRHRRRKSVSVRASDYRRQWCGAEYCRRRTSPSQGKKPRKQDNSTSSLAQGGSTSFPTAALDWARFQDVCS